MLGIYINSPHSPVGLIFHRDGNITLQCQMPKCVSGGCDITRENLHIFFGLTSESRVDFKELLSTRMFCDFAAN